MARDPIAFLSEDYKQRIAYLSSHFGRMWTRFNFFVTLESALLGGKLLFSDDVLNPYVGPVGCLLSLVWWVMGAQDRFLVDFYRWQVKQAAARLRDGLASIAEGLPSTPASSSAGEGAPDANTRRSPYDAAIKAAEEYVGSVEEPLLRQHRDYRNDTKPQRTTFGYWAGLSSWRVNGFSPTHLAAWIPLLLLVLWITYTVCTFWPK